MRMPLLGIGNNIVQRFLIRIRLKADVRHSLERRVPPSFGIALSTGSFFADHLGLLARGLQRNKRTSLDERIRLRGNAIVIISNGCQCAFLCAVGNDIHILGTIWELSAIFPA